MENNTKWSSVRPPASLSNTSSRQRGTYFFTILPPEKSEIHNWYANFMRIGKILLKLIFCVVN